jgi:hypothetical protein
MIRESPLDGKLRGTVPDAKDAFALGLGRLAPNDGSVDTRSQRGCQAADLQAIPKSQTAKKDLIGGNASRFESRAGERWSRPGTKIHVKCCLTLSIIGMTICFMSFR